MRLVLQLRLVQIVSMVQFSGRAQHAHSPKSSAAHRFCLILVSLLLSACVFFHSSKVAKWETGESYSAVPLNKSPIAKLMTNS